MDLSVPDNRRGICFLEHDAAEEHIDQETVMPGVVQDLTRNCAGQPGSQMERENVNCADDGALKKEVSLIGDVMRKKAASPVWS